MNIGSISNFIEDAIGAADLNREQRRELLVEQLNSVYSMALGVILGASAIMCAILLSSNGQPAFPDLIIWAFYLIFAHFVAIFSWYKYRLHLAGRMISLRIIKYASFVAFLFGIIWGLMPIIALPHAGPDLATTVYISATGVFCITAFALAAIPQTVTWFAIPMIAGMTIGIVNQNMEIQVASAPFLLICFMMIIPALTLRYARTFTRHVVTEIAMREQKDIIGLLLKEYEENSSDWLWEIDESNRVNNPSNRFLDVCQAEADELGGADFLKFLSDKTSDFQTINTLKKLMLDKQPFRDVELTINIYNKTQIWHLTGKPNRDENGVYHGYIGIGSDVTFAKDAEHKISQLAHSDALTGLMNRASFNTKLEGAVAKLERFGTGFGMMFLDLDKFKIINDTRGHSTGDKLLIQVSNRILETVRESDEVARLGGDEFAIILNENCDAGAAAKLAAKLISHLCDPYEIDGESHKVGVSIGIALAPQNGTRPAQILRNADLALYRSKDDGRGVFRFFERQMDADQREKRMLEHELREAIDNNEFELFFQPLISPETGKPTGAESLIRWNHPMRGLISPAEFIPLAEQSSIIQEIGNWSIHEACMAALNWPDDISVTVNISASHFVGSDIVANTKRALEDTKLPPHRFEIEITESLLIDNTDDVLNTLSALKALGITIALDDFGTGYSSLSYVLKFPFDKIKIDQSFVSESVKDPTARAILKMIGALGESLDIKITAEGVETLTQIEILSDIKCHQYQGFYFAKPMNKVDLSRYFLKQFRNQIDDKIGKPTKKATK